MLKRLMLMLLMLAVVTGCAGNIKQGVQGNTFYSTYPELAVKLAPEFEYVDNEKSYDFGSAQGNRIDYTPGYDINEFIFVDRLTRKGGRISISKLTGRGVYWSPNFTQGIANLIVAGHEDHLGDRYQYAVYPLEGENGECYLAKSMARILGGKLNTLFEIFYYEPLNDQPLECRQWENGQASLNDSQQKQLQQFLENSSRNMRLMNLENLNLAAG